MLPMILTLASGFSFQKANQYNFFCLCFNLVTTLHFQTGFTYLPHHEEVATYSSGAEIEGTKVFDNC